jgi:hypothetical protein
MAAQFAAVFLSLTSQHEDAMLICSAGDQRALPRLWAEPDQRMPATALFCPDPA